MRDQGFDFRIYLVRHGQSGANLQPELIGGHLPFTPLTQLGQAQARSLGERLKAKKLEPDSIFTSPTRRTKQTAHIICDRLGISPRLIRVHKALCEVDQGAWTSKPRAECHTPEQLERMDKLAQDFAPPGGESQRQAGRRMWRWLEDMVLTDARFIRNDRPTHILAVSHSLAIKCLLHQILGFDAHLTWRWEIANCSLSILRFTPRGWFPVCINDMGHLLGIS